MVNKLSGDNRVKTAMLAAWVVLGVAQGAGAAEPLSAELLGKLAQQETRLTQELEQGAYSVSGHSEELDGDGKLVHTRETLSKVTQEGGKKVVRVERVVLDGKDVTDAERAKERDRKQRQLQSPFAAAAQAKHQFTVIGPDPANAGLVRLRFEPKPKERSTSTFVGEAVVDTAAGELVWLRERPAENPAFVDRLEVEVAMGAASPTGRHLASVRVDGKGGMLFLKRGFRVRLRFSDWAEPPQASR